VLFLGYCVWLTIALMQKIGSSRMAIIDWPIGIVYGFVCAGFALDDLARNRRGHRQLEARRVGAGAARIVRGGALMGPASFKLSFLGLMASGIPVAIAMAGASLVYVMVSGNVPDYVVIHRMVGGLDSFPLLAVPFFIFAGNLMNSAGITNRIYNFALALVGWMRGGWAT
jgi:hypothetical protein